MRNLLLLSLVLALTVAAPTGAPAGVVASHLADHLVISEVGFDTTNEGVQATTSEYVEIYNPSYAPVILNQGAVPGTANGLPSFFLSDATTQYFKVPGGNVATGATSDFVLQFPLSSVLAARQFAVICNDSDAFLGEFYGGDLATFAALPGHPILFEAKQDGAADGVPDMIPRHTGSGAMSLTNGGESATLYRWDGQSDLVQDVDIAVWKVNSETPNKTGVTFDGPDADALVSSYDNDAHSILFAPGGAPNTTSIQRMSLTEFGEADVGGNGITDQDETGEDWTAFGTGWVADLHSPGLPNIRLDGNVTDGQSWLPALAVSAADGPGAGATPADFGADGTLTELYVGTVDTNGNRVPDALYLQVRGDLFGSNGAVNASFVWIDLDPGAGTGAKLMIAPANQLDDTTGALDSRLTSSGFQLSAPLIAAGAGFDAAVGLDDSAGGPDVSGWRLFGSGGTAGGSFTNFAFGTSEARFQAAAGGYPAAPGASHGGGKAFEARIAFTELGPALGPTPAFIRLVAVTTSDAAGAPSPNTLPESTSDAFTTTQIIDRVLCYDVAAGQAVSYFVDGDGDGFGGAASDYCGPAIAGVATVAGDCNDGAIGVHPGATESCNGVDDDCVGGVPANEADGDGDGTRICAGDCNDGAATVHPGAAELCNGVDDDCAGGVPASEADADNDGFRVCAADCDDGNAAAHPGGTEVCDATNSDEDCDGLSDDADLSATGQTPFFNDGDSDGFGAGSPIQRCDASAGQVATSTDCNDSVPTIHPGAAELCNGVDDDCAAGVPAVEADGDSDGVRVCAGDCNDAAPTIHPGAVEACNGVDDDCAAGVPANEADGDADGSRICAGDCDDAVDTIHPGAVEACNGVDDDCAGGVPANEADGDADGSRICAGDCNDGAAAIHPGATELCNGVDDDCAAGVPASEADGDADGFRICGGDCNDGNAAVSPADAEVCNGVDDDCDASIDDGVTTLFFLDADGDGFGIPGTTLAACTLPAGYSTLSTDCNDASPAVNPAATEVCNTIDDDCDAQTDEGVLTTFFMDMDGDGFGGAVTAQACSAPAGFVAVAGDCNDAAMGVHPGATEQCNGVDDDCDANVPVGEADADSDAVRVCAGDCDDANPAIHPGLPDTPGDGIDQDCSGADATGADLDLDGVTDVTDCDDHDATVHPGATERCDGKDTDCDPATSEDDDTDADGASLCDGDCALDDPAIFPDAVETCNDVDDNCNQQIDEGIVKDADGDGHENSTCAGDDCDDDDNTIYPGATDVPGDGIDQDCAGGDAPFPDADGDGHTADDDCDDSSADVHPDATELCEGGIDEDCDGLIDVADFDCDGVPQTDGGSCACRIGGQSSHGGAPAGLAAALLIGVVLVRRKRG